MAKKEKEKLPDKVNIHYIKNSGFRQIHADGAIGGITPRGELNINFYAERIIIPKSEEVSIKDDGKLGDRLSISEDSKKGIVREIEVGAYMDIEVAKNLRKWLELKIKEYEQFTKKG